MTLHRGRDSSGVRKTAGLRGGSLCLFAVGCMLAGAGWLPAAAQVVIFEDAGVAQVAELAVPHEILAEALPGAQFRSATELPEALSRTEARLLVRRTARCFPEEDWQTIVRFPRGRPAICWCWAGARSHGLPISRAGSGTCGRRRMRMPDNFS